MSDVVYILYRSNNHKSDAEYNAEVVAVYANQDTAENVVQRKNKQLQEEGEWVQQYFLEETEVIRD